MERFNYPVHFIYRKGQEITSIYEFVPRQDVRKRFDSTTNHLLENSLEFLAEDPSHSVVIELVRK